MGFAHVIFWVFLAAAATVITVLTGIAQTSRLEAIPQAAVEKRGYAIRRWWFRAIVVTLAAGLAATVPFFPYPKAGAAASPRRIA